LSGIVLFILLLVISNIVSPPVKKLIGFSFCQSNGTKKLQEFCGEIDISDSKSRLNNIFMLENKRKQLSNDIKYYSIFSSECEEKLNNMRMLAIPELGQDNYVIKALTFLCNVPKNSESLTEAKVWLDRWYYSPT